MCCKLTGKHITEQEESCFISYRREPAPYLEQKFCPREADHHTLPRGRMGLVCLLHPEKISRHWRRTGDSKESQPAEIHMLSKGEKRRRRKKKGVDCRRQDDFIFAERSKAVSSWNGVAFNFLMKHFGEYCFKRSARRKIKTPNCHSLYYYE